MQGFPPIYRGFPHSTVSERERMRERERERETPVWMKGRRLHECMCGVKNPRVKNSLYACLSLLRQPQPPDEFLPCSFSSGRPGAVGRRNVFQNGVLYYPLALGLGYRVEG